MANSRGSRRAKRNAAELKEASRLSNAPCARCGQAIDYYAPRGDPASFNAGHIKAWSKYPHLREDPANLQPEHALCNQDAGDSDEKPGIGLTSEEW